MFGLSEIRLLIGTLRQAPVAELDVEKGGWRIRIRRHVGEPAVPASVAATDPPGEPPLQDNPASATDNDADRVIVAPGYGVFHRAAAPGDAPYVEIGQEVEQGQQIGLIEAMKLFCAVTSPFSGRVVEIHVGDGEEVEAGARLLRLS